MFKKMSYLASVSVLASVVMGTASYAVHEDELGEIITSFSAQQKAQKSLEKKEASKEEDAGWWGYASSFGSAVGNGVSKTLRWGGDQIRGDTIVGDILTEKAKGAVSHLGGSSASTIIDKVNEKESSASSARQAFGNSLRYAGTLFVNETPTLERALRKFWINKREADDADQVLTSTACALYLYKDKIGGVDGVRNSYRKFLKAWNSNSYTVHSNDTDKNNEYFLKGLIRGFARDKKNIQNYEDIAAYMKVFNINYEELSLTKKITAESILEKGEKVGDVTLGRIQKARQDEFMKFVVETFELENNKLLIDQSEYPLMIETTSGSSQPFLQVDLIKDIEDDKPGGQKETEEGKGKEKMNVKDEEKEKMNVKDEEKEKNNFVENTGETGILETNKMNNVD